MYKSAARWAQKSHLPQNKEPALSEHAIAALDKPQWCSVYIVGARACGPLKIGYTTNASQERLRQLQMSSPIKLRLFKEFHVPSEQIARELERMAHHCLRHHRRHGEWFERNVTQASLGVVEAAAAAGIALYTQADIEAFARSKSLFK